MMFTFLFGLCMALAGTKLAPAGDSTVPVNKTKILQLVNDARKKGCNCGSTYYGPAPALTWNDKLEKAAFDHSKDMSSHNYFNHDTPSGVTPGQRIKTAGYKWSAYGENIGEGYADEAAMVQGWLESPGHCSNIMSKLFKELGAANVNSYWTADFATQ